jgi:hypothetical protein
LELVADLAPDRRALLDHEVYSRVRSLADLQTFQENHVFAVWDFMCLLKQLQRDLTCVTVPWIPPAHPEAARLINEIVLGEEADDLPRGVQGHFDLYRSSMVETGASTGAIDVFTVLLRGGASVEASLDDAGAPAPASAFVRATFAILSEGSLPAVAAAFTYGREDVIPAMFERLIATLGEAHPEAFPGLRSYLDRHIELDGDEHGPAAQRMLVSICGRDETRWEAARRGARHAIRARIALWDAIVSALEPAVDRAAISQDAACGPATG